MEAADAPSTPTAEAKRPNRAAAAEAPAAEASLSPEPEPQLAQQVESASADQPIPQHPVGESTLQVASSQEPQTSSSSSGPHHEAVILHDRHAQSSQQQLHAQSSPAASADLALADQAGSSNEPKRQDDEHQAAGVPEADQPSVEIQDSAVQELKRQRSLEIEAHLAQVRLTVPLHAVHTSQDLFVLHLWSFFIFEGVGPSSVHTFGLGGDICDGCVCVPLFAKLTLMARPAPCR